MVFKWTTAGTYCHRFKVNWKHIHSPLLLNIHWMQDSRSNCMLCVAFKTMHVVVPYTTGLCQQANKAHKKCHDTTCHSSIFTIYIHVLNSPCRILSMNYSTRFYSCSQKIKFYRSVKLKQIDGTTQGRVIIVSSPTKLQSVSFSHVFVVRPSEGVTDLDEMESEQHFQIIVRDSFVCFSHLPASRSCVDVKGFCA